ncbi:MAG: hypothetical protein FJ224_10235 [Lentisphaerae bacterium]|nr:hypothetical protein [Lentisphaerota bacterium]
MVDSSGELYSQMSCHGSNTPQLLTTCKLQSQGPTPMPVGLMRAADALRYVPAHLYYFKRDQLLALLRRAGFEPVFVRTYGRWRSRRGPARRAYDAARDALCLGNKIRVIARKR